MTGSEPEAITTFLGRVGRAIDLHPAWPGQPRVAAQQVDALPSSQAALAVSS